jgi:hypothetical protein
VSPRKLVFALVLASAVAFGWLAPHDAPEASAAPAPASTELKKLDKELAGSHAKKKGTKKGHKKAPKKGHKNGHKKHKK